MARSSIGLVSNPSGSSSQSRRPPSASSCSSCTWSTYTQQNYERGNGVCYGPVTKRGVLRARNDRYGPVTHPVSLRARNTPRYHARSFAVYRCSKCTMSRTTRRVGAGIGRRTRSGSTPTRCCSAPCAWRSSERRAGSLCLLVYRVCTASCAPEFI